MRSQPAVTVKIFVVLIPVLVFGTILTVNSKAKISVSDNDEPIAVAGDAAGLYTRSCARCHGADGRAQTAKGKQTGATDFTSAKWQPSEAKGIRTITNGKGKMPSFKGTLNAEQIRSVWNYVRSFRH